MCKTRLVPGAHAAECRGNFIALVVIQKFEPLSDRRQGDFGPTEILEQKFPTTAVVAQEFVELRILRIDGVFEFVALRAVTVANHRIARGGERPAEFDEHALDRMLERITLRDHGLRKAHLEIAHDREAFFERADTGDFERRQGGRAARLFQ